VYKSWESEIAGQPGKRQKTCHESSLTRFFKRHPAMRLRWEDADESHTKGNPSTEDNEGNEDATPLRSLGFLLFKTCEQKMEDETP